jgi:hypothetical protein
MTGRMKMNYNKTTLALGVSFLIGLAGCGSPTMTISANPSERLNPALTDHQRQALAARGHGTDDEHVAAGSVPAPAKNQNHFSGD